MVDVCGVRLSPNGKIYWFAPGDTGVEEGDLVVVETAHGNLLGEVVHPVKQLEKSPDGSELKQVLRIARDDDLTRAAENEELAKKAFDICRELIAKQGLEMKLFKTEYNLERSKAVFYYVSEQRVDFRNLVKELAPRIKIRIEMVQVGPREHAKAIGGIGLCGRQFCCQGFMTTFGPVTIKMAKDQGLTSNPTKYSGSCGKLLCCIRHEEAAYEYAHGIMPKNGTLIMTEDGPGKIVVVNMLKETCTVKVGLEQNFEIKSYGVDQIRALTDTEKAEYMALRKKEKEEMEAAEAQRRASRNDDERPHSSEPRENRAEMSGDESEVQGERGPRTQTSGEGRNRSGSKRHKSGKKSGQKQGAPRQETPRADADQNSQPGGSRPSGKRPNRKIGHGGKGQRGNGKAEGKS